MTEIAGGAALTFNPNDINELSEKIKSISGSVNSKSISPLAKSLSQKGIKRAEEFTWQETAKETIKYYQELLND